MNASSWREHPGARDELLTESDRLRIDIAEQLIDRAESAIDDVLASPGAWPRVHYWDGQPTLRQRKIKPFRINVVYYVTGDEVRVIAYAHERRRPGYWANRIDDWG